MTLFIQKAIRARRFPIAECPFCEDVCIVEAIVRLNYVVCTCCWRQLNTAGPVTVVYVSRETAYQFTDQLPTKYFSRYLRLKL